MLKRILSFAIVLSLTFATGIGVYGTETEFTLPVSGELMGETGMGGAVTGIGQTPKTDYSQPQENSNRSINQNENTTDNSLPIVEEKATK
jgi:hypothetical protein